MFLLFSPLSHVWLFWDPMDYSPPNSSVHEILQARILTWVAVPFSRGSSWPRDGTWVSCIGRQILYHGVTGKAQSHKPMSCSKGPTRLSSDILAPFLSPGHIDNFQLLEETPAGSLPGKFIWLIQNDPPAEFSCPDLLFLQVSSSESLLRVAFPDPLQKPVPLESS